MQVTYHKENPVRSSELSRGCEGPRGREAFLGGGSPGLDRDPGTAEILAPWRYPSLRLRVRSLGPREAPPRLPVVTQPLAPFPSTEPSLVSHPALLRAPPSASPRRFSSPALRVPPLKPQAAPPLTPQVAPPALSEAPPPPLPHSSVVGWARLSWRLVLGAVHWARSLSCWRVMFRLLCFNRVSSLVFSSGCVVQGLALG